MEETNLDSKKKTMRLLLIFNTVLLTVGNCGGPLIMRLYFIHGGKRVWLSNWLKTGSWPITFIPLIITYLHRRSKQGPRAKVFFMKPPVFLVVTVIGALKGLDDYIYAEGMAQLPVSTLTIIIASHLGFKALFVCLLVKQKFTTYSINAVVLLTIGPGVLALHTSGDQPKGTSHDQKLLSTIRLSRELRKGGTTLLAVMKSEEATGANLGDALLFVGLRCSVARKVGEVVQITKVDRGGTEQMGLHPKPELWRAGGCLVHNPGRDVAGSAWNMQNTGQPRDVTLAIDC